MSEPVNTYRYMSAGHPVHDMCTCGHTRGWHNALIERCSRWVQQPQPINSQTHVGVPYRLCDCVRFVPKPA